MRWRLVIAGLVVGIGAPAPGLLAGCRSDAPSPQRAKVEQILFLPGDRILLRNQLGDLFVSTGNTDSWKKLDGHVYGLAVANRNEIWGTYGGLSEHTLKPHAKVWHSRDAGTSWEETELVEPSGFSCNRRMTYADSELSQVPIQFIQKHDDPPLLLMFNLQLMRPKAGEGVAEWDRVGTRVPAPSVHQREAASGVQHEGAIYVSANNRIYLSTDGANTWSSQKLHSFSNSQIRCRKDRCYALLSELRSGWVGVFTTRAGSNAWTELGSLSDAVLADTLRDQAAKFGAIDHFAATAILPATDGVYLAGIVNGLLSPEWGAILFISDAGQLRAPTAAPYGFWELAQHRDGSLWAGGKGAYQWTKQGWRQVWMYTTAAQ